MKALILPARGEGTWAQRGWRGPSVPQSCPQPVPWVPGPELGSLRLGACPGVTPLPLAVGRGSPRSSCFHLRWEKSALGAGGGSLERIQPRGEVGHGAVPTLKRPLLVSGLLRSGPGSTRVPSQLVPGGWVVPLPVSPHPTAAPGREGAAPDAETPPRSRCPGRSHRHHG